MRYSKSIENIGSPPLNGLRGRSNNWGPGGWIASHEVGQIYPTSEGIVGPGRRHAPTIFSPISPQKIDGSPSYCYNILI